MDIAELEIVVSSRRAEEATRRLRDNLKQTSAAAAAVGGTGTAAVGRLGTAATAASSRFAFLNRQMTFSLGIMGQFIGLFTAFAAGRGLVADGDAFVTMQNRIRAVGVESQHVAAIQEELLQVSNRTRSSWQASAEVYSRVALAARDLGVSQQQVIRFTENLNRAVLLSGASTQEAAAGMIQLSQGLASGTLRGDELRSVLEQLPVVADVIADHMGITRGELRKMGEQGLITAKIVLDAFEAADQSLGERFGRSVATVGQSATVLRNELVKLAGAVGEEGLGAALQSAIGWTTEFVRVGSSSFAEFKLAAITSWNAVASTADNVFAGILWVSGKAVEGMILGIGAVRSAWSAGMAFLEGLVNNFGVALNQSIADGLKAVQSFAKWAPGYGSAAAALIGAAVSEIEAGNRKVVDPIQQASDAWASAQEEAKQVSSVVGEFSDTVMAGLVEREKARAEAAAAAAGAYERTLTAGRELAKVPDTAGPGRTATDPAEVIRLYDAFGTADMGARMLQNRIHQLKAELADDDWIRTATVEDFRAKTEEMQAMSEALVRKFEQDAVRASDAFDIGFRQVADSWGTQSQRMAEAGAGVADSFDRNFTDGLVSMIDGTKDAATAFREMSNAIISDLIRIAVQQFVVRQLLSSLSFLGGGGGTGGTGGGTAPTFHDGGVAGGPAPHRAVNPSAFYGASRYQGGGFAADEVPAILHRGERVQTEEQQAADAGGRGTKIEIMNVVDPEMAGEWLAKNPGAFINLLSRHAPAARRALRIER